MGIRVEVEEEEMVVEVEVEETVSNVGSRVTGPENALVVAAAVAVAGILLGMVILEGVEAAMVTREAVIGMVIGQVAVTAAEAQVGMGKKDVQKIVTGTVAAMVLVVTGMAVAVVEAPHAMKGGPKIALVLMIVQVVAAGHPMIEGGMIMHLESACLSSCWFL